MPRRVSGNGGGGGPAARSVSASGPGAVYAVARLLGGSSTLALVAAGTHANLTLAGVNITAGAAIIAGQSQTAVIRESVGQLAVEYPVTIVGTGAAATLSALTLAASSIVENSAAGTAVGGILGKTAGSTLSLLNDAGGRFAISGTTLVAGATGTDYESAASHAITIRETLAGATNTPRDTTLTITVVNQFEAPNLGALSLSATTFNVGTPSNGSITGATAGSTIVASNLPAGLTVNGAARTWAWDGTGSISTPTITLTETLADSANSPRASNVALTITAVPSILSASTRAAILTLGAVQATTGWLSYRCGHRTNVAGSNMRLHYAAGFVSSAGNSSDLIGTQPVTIRAAVIINPTGTGLDQTGGTLIQCTFFDMLSDSSFTGTVSGDGKKVTIPAGKTAYTDKVAATLTAGSRWLEQVEIGYVNGTSVGNDSIVTTAGDYGVTSATDPAGASIYSKNPAGMNQGGGTVSGAFAVTIEGAPGAKAVLVHGDSILWGTAGSGATMEPVNADGVRSGLLRALADLGYSVFAAPVPSSQLYNLATVAANQPFRKRISEIGTIGATISNLGTNDRATGGPWSNVSSNFQWFWDWIKTLTGGARFIQCTLSPRTTSTDGYITEANQTDQLGGSHWCVTTLNPSLRQQNFGALGSGTQKPDGFYDFALALEATAKPRVFKPNLTVDGLHPSQSPGGHKAVYDDAIANLPNIIGFHPATGAPTPIVYTPEISITASAAQIEGNSGVKAFPFTVYAYPAPATDLAVNLQFNQGSTDAADFQGGALPTVNSATILAGQNTATVNIMVAGDTTAESDEPFGLTVLTGAGYRLAPASVATTVIQNDDANGGIVFQSDFTGTTGTLLTDAPNYMSLSALNNAPTFADQTNYQIDGNNAYAASRWSLTGYNYGHVVRDAAAANHSVKFDLVNSLWDFLPVFGEVDGNNFLFMQVLYGSNSNPGFSLCKMQGGVVTNLIVNTYWYVPAATVSLEIQFSGNAIKVFADGVQYVNQPFAATPTPQTGTTSVAVPGTVNFSGGTKAGFYAQAASAGKADNLLIKQI